MNKAERQEQFEIERNRILKTIEEIRNDPNFSKGIKDRMIEVAYQSIADKRMELGL